MKIEVKNMHLSINIVLVILMYQCWTTCTSRLSIERHQAEIPSKSGFGMFLKSLSSIGKRTSFLKSNISSNFNHTMENTTSLEFIIEGFNNVKSIINQYTVRKRGPINTNPTLVAVSKTKSIEQIICLYKQGQRHFGENYVQELFIKSYDPEIISQCPEIKWHFIGHLQRNKLTKLLMVPGLYAVETVDSAKLAQTINEKWKTHITRYVLKVMIQVNTSNEKEKSGVSPDKVVELYKYIRDNCDCLELTGLMTIGQYGYDCSKEPNPDFLALVECKKKIVEELKLDYSEVELSMGMSTDYEHAIQLGSSSVRVGSAIFGYRPRKEKQ